MTKHRRKQTKYRRKQTKYRRKQTKHRRKQTKYRSKQTKHRRTKRQYHKIKPYHGGTKCGYNITDWFFKSGDALGYEWKNPYKGKGSYQANNDHSIQHFKKIDMHNQTAYENYKINCILNNS